MMIKIEVRGNSWEMMYTNTGRVGIIFDMHILPICGGPSRTEG